MEVKTSTIARRTVEEVETSLAVGSWQDGEYLPGRFDPSHNYVTWPARSTADAYLVMATLRRLRGLKDDRPLPLVQDAELNDLGKEVL